MWSVTLVAVAAAVLLAAAAAVLLRPGPRPLLAAGVATLCAVVITVLAGDATGALPAPTAVALASGCAPVGVALAAAARGAGLHPVALLVSAAVWGGVLVPFTLVAPPALVALCPPTACIVADFGGTLPYVVGVGALLLVPASLVRPGEGPVVRVPARPAVGAGLAAWGLFAVWLMALEGAWDEYTPRIALAAVLAPAAGAVGWLLVDRIRGIDATLGRALRLGLLAGMGGIVGPVVAVTTPWAPLIGLICGIAGALTHDAKGLATARPAVRGAATAIVVGAIGMASAGIVGASIGFVFAARFDVIGSQLLSVLVVLALGVVLSVPVAVLLIRQGEARAARTAARRR